MTTQHLFNESYNGFILGFAADYVFAPRNGDLKQSISGDGKPCYLWAEYAAGQYVVQGLNHGALANSGHTNRYNAWSWGMSGEKARMPLDILDGLMLTARTGNRTSVGVPFAAIRPGAGQPLEEALFRFPLSMYRNVQVDAEIPEAIGSRYGFDLIYRICVVERVKERVKK